MKNALLQLLLLLSFFLYLNANETSVRKIPISGGIGKKLPSWSCPVLKPHTPKDVNDLKPNNIKVVMALGDSITAGFSITNGILENRGMSWSIGSDEGITTIPNILASVSNHTIYGASYGSHIPELPRYAYHVNDVLNGAQSNARSFDLMYQVNYLVSKLLEANATGTINLEKDWKMLTILIGANNVCWVCQQPTDKATYGDKFEADMRLVLQEVNRRVPKVFVNLVNMFNVSQVYTVAVRDKAWRCLGEHSVIGPLECKCAFGKSDSDRVFMDEVAQEYNKRMAVLSKEFADLKQDDFAVVVQPMFKDLDIPSTSYLSTLDCFHPNQLAHGKMATALWNTIITPVSQKKTNWKLDDPVICPDDESRLFTK